LLTAPQDEREAAAMSAKTSSQRRAAFFAALSETGNQTIAAERARVSRSWVQLQRSIDPEFRAQVAAAVAEARASILALRMSGEGGCKPPAKWGAQEGEDLVLRGGRGKRVQIARARLRQWTPRLEELFIRALTATCNVKLACRAVGLSAPSAYKHRERWPAFAERWDAAIPAGWTNVDSALVTGAIALLDPEVDPPEALGPMSVDQAIRLVGLHQRRAIGIGKWPGVRR
jgi:hypothetical protein